jgi:hypothetical protein
LEMVNPYNTGSDDPMGVVGLSNLPQALSLQPQWLQKI